MMIINSSNIHAHELIGLEARIVESSDKGLVGLTGKIVYETKNMLFIKVNSSIKKIPKGIVKIEFTINDERCIVEGKSIIGRPEDRIRRL